MTPTQAAEATPDPRFSIIVPAYGVEAYLRDCLDSVLSQSFGDFEVIAVNDASPDACGEIMEEYAAADPRVVTVQLEQNVGLGRARNAGMARARGAYLLFLDSDDTLLPGSLQAVARRLNETDDPDLLVFDYSRTHWDGRVTPNAKRSVLAKSPSGTFRLDDNPELLGLLQVAWNKAYRRDFVERWGFVYPQGYYEDTPWTYPVLVAAETITVLDRVCVHYRQRRQGSILHSTNRKHFDVFDQYELVFAFIADHPGFARWQSALFERMTTHLRVIDKSPGRLPDDARAEFRARWAQAERAHRPAGYREPTGGSRTSLAARAARRLPRPLRSAARKARRLPGKLKPPVRTAVLAGYYRAQRMLPVKKDVAVFAAYWNTDYACNPAAVHQKLLELAPEIKTVWVLKAGSRNTPPPGTAVVHPGSFGFWRAMARGKYFVNNVNFPTRVLKRPGQVHVQTHHGTPLKRMGVDLVDYPIAQGELEMQTLMQRVDRWDYSVSSNSFTTAVWERAYPAEYTSLDYGYPRNDVLVNATDEDRARAREKLGLAPGAKVVLYAPTHRDYHVRPRPLLDLEHFAERLGEDFTVLARAHYFNLVTGAGAADGSRIVDVSGHTSIEELFLAADCLLTDYSSLMFDYALLDRPIVIFANDWEIYRATRGTYFDIHVESPGHVVETEEDLLGVFLSGRWSDDNAAKARAEFRRRFCEYDDGRAAERLVRRVFLDQEQVPPVAVSPERPSSPAHG
ncbi:bifunctional glycosyltransferase/CDP-glycerol:glycerophosphate glycerophosphotransferase [Streptomyces sp. NPDC054884]|uniref:bifunctional glycosyltransferase/CDP-glycerol:glycerophosphate glycerophosphotransferase n=1 Tax=Streptomyces sp. ME08-AFT2 TaxID=3028683 RepID=UPI0029AA6267|nr:bifunctional glycosyltransferase family 2 protein/CDP-glycerol:glycerophosphate glycerophosphotransferase [Streptomyces sp. ME08-AFT2]MDX3311040.1 bifunctional glycosyltransferase family 2 protein/CDP-glycerol:glycerophosphate glycerophosphotransferase [Streptomyces sp. ME08-AFT2]